MKKNTIIVVSTAFDGSLLDSMTIQTTHDIPSITADIKRFAEGVFRVRAAADEKSIIISQLALQTEIPTMQALNTMFKYARNLGLSIDEPGEKCFLSDDGCVTKPVTITGRITTPYSEASNTALLSVVLEAKNEDGDLVTNFNDAREIQITEKTTRESLMAHVKEMLLKLSGEFSIGLCELLADPTATYALGQSTVEPTVVQPDLSLPREFKEGMRNEQVQGRQETTEPHCCSHAHENPIQPIVIELPGLDEMKNAPSDETFAGYARVSQPAPAVKVRENPDFVMSVMILDNPDQPRIRYVKFTGMTSELANNGFVAGLDREITRINAAGEYGRYGLSLSGGEDGMMQLQQGCNGNNYANLIHRTIEGISLNGKVDVDFIDQLPPAGSYVVRIQDTF